jgi:hypothetical protein
MSFLIQPAVQIGQPIQIQPIAAFLSWRTNPIRWPTIRSTSRPSDFYQSFFVFPNSMSPPQPSIQQSVVKKFILDLQLRIGN